MEGICESFERIAKLRKKNERISELRKIYTRVGPIVDLCFNPKYVWLLPEGTPPYKPQPKEADVQGVLMQSAKKFAVFLQNNGYDGLKTGKREQIFIEYLEAMDPDDAKLMLQVKDRKMPFKNLTKSLFEEAYPQLKRAWEAKKN
tara:strand:+ start:6687 stop:7121 length:435 start_codon:yes stop_codon:yes gene_type:complete